MKKSPLPINEAARMSSLVKLDVLDTEPEECFDRIVRLVKHAFNAPVVLITLADNRRQWFLSKQGVVENDISQESSFSMHVISSMSASNENSNTVIEISDAARDSRFSENPLVTGEPYVRFYAGLILKSIDGSILGTLSMIDHEPRVFTLEETNRFYDFGMIAQNTLQSLCYEDKDLHTGLYNRRGFYSVSDYVLSNSIDQALNCSVVYAEFLDYTRFVKQFGRLIESDILAEFVTTLESTFRSTDIIARIGNNQFAVLTVHSPSFEIENVLIPFKQKIKESNASKQNQYQISYNIGSFSFDPEYVQSAGKLLDLIDKRILENNYSESCSLKE